MKNLFLLLIICIAGCKPNVITHNISDTTKLLLSEEITLCSNCKAFNGTDTLKIIKYEYDSDNRIISIFTIHRGVEQSVESAKYIYDKFGNVTEEQSHSEAISDTIDYAYINNIPAYSYNKSSKQHAIDYTVTKDKIVRATKKTTKSTFTFTYKGGNLLTTDLVGDDVAIHATNRYGSKKNPLYQCSFKWQNIPRGYNCADNEIIQTKLLNTKLDKVATINNFAYVYNSQGYPDKRIDSFILGVGEEHSGFVTYYKYTPAK